MDNKRTLTRGRPKSNKKPEEKKNSVRSSPSRKASPSRRSSPLSARKSPSRRASPSRKASPSRRSSPGSRPASTTSTRSSRQRSAAVITPIPLIPPSPIKEKNEKTTPSTKSGADKVHATLLPTATNLTTTTTTSSVHSSYSISTQKTVEIGSSKNISGDSEIAKLTNSIRRSISKTFSTSRGGSETPSTHTSQISRSVSQSAYGDGDNYSKMEFSDSEDENFKSVNITTKSTYSPLLEKSASICRKLQVPKEFGGLPGASLLLLVLPVLVYYLPWCCKKTVCEFKIPNVAVLMDLKYLEKVFQGQAVGSFIAFSSGVFVLSTVLFGRFVRLPNDRIGSGFLFNALPIAVIATIGLVVGEYMAYPVVDFILKNYLRYCLYSLLNALIIAIWCYARSNYIAANDVQMNPYGKSGNFIIDFCLGKHVNPKWFGRVEIKQVYYKISLIFTLLLAEAYIYKNIQLPSMGAGESSETTTWVGRALFLVKFYSENIKFDLISLASSLMLLCYVLDSIVFEHQLASSFELQQEGVGALLLLRYAATPFFLNAIPKFLFEHKPVVLPQWALILMVTLFLSGLTLKRLSNTIKYKYRINPNLPIFIGVETVHTFQGRRLLLGNLWGSVRQPNYAGDILALLSFTLPLIFKFAWPPLVCVLLLVAFLIHRAVRVSARNSTRYHSSWVRYCMKVRHLVVPKIF